MQIVDMGETALDEETFQQYLAEIREHYTADKVGVISGQLITGLMMFRSIIY